MGREPEQRVDDGIVDTQREREKKENLMKHRNNDSDRSDSEVMNKKKHLKD